MTPTDEALGRGRGGFSTKVHLACDGRGRPLSVLVTAGQRNEAPELGALLLDGIRVARPEGNPGRPRKRPHRLLADRGYAHDSCRALLRRRGILHIIPERRDHTQGAPAKARRQATLLRRRGLPRAQRCGEMREPPQAVAGGGDEV